MNTDKLRNAKNIDEFVAEYDKILSDGEYEAVVEAIAESTENEELRMMARTAPAMVADDVLLKVAREVWKVTEGKRDVADLVGAAEGSMCRMCRWGDFCGVVCRNAKRREADLAAGLDEAYCGAVGREPLFTGGLCDFFEIDAGEEEEDEEVQAGHCNQYQHEEGCPHDDGVDENDDDGEAQYLKKFKEKDFKPRIDKLSLKDLKARPFYEKSAYPMKKETQDDPAPFYEFDGKRVFLVDVSRHLWNSPEYRMWDMYQKEVKGIEERWENWKKEALNVLKKTEKPSVYEKIKESLEEHDGVRNATLKKRIEAGVLSRPEFMTFKERDKAEEAIKERGNEAQERTKAAREAFYSMKRNYIAKWFKDRGLNFSEDTSGKSESFYFYVGDGFKVRLSDHDWPGDIPNPAHVQMRYWESNEEIDMQLEDLMKRMKNKDFTFAKDHKARPIREGR